MPYKLQPGEENTIENTVRHIHNYITDDDGRYRGEGSLRSIVGLYVNHTHQLDKLKPVLKEFIDAKGRYNTMTTYKKLIDTLNELHIFP